MPLAIAGYAGSLNDPANDATTATATFALSNALTGTVPAPEPAGIQDLYFTFKTSAATTFLGSFDVSPVVLPPGISTAGSFVETLYDLTTGLQIGFASGSVSGQTIAFGSVTGQSFTTTAGDQYLFVISNG